MQPADIGLRRYAAMKSLPGELAHELIGFKVSTVRAQRWLRVRNGVLLSAAADAGVAALVTADQNIPNQQNLSTIGVSVVVIAGIRNGIEDLRMLIPQLRTALKMIRPGEFLEIRPDHRDSVRDRGFASAAA